MMELYQHFRKEEHHFIDQVLEWRELVKTQYYPKLTDFLDPREQQIVQLVIGHDDDVRLSFFGGSPFVERKRALLYPPYFQPEEPKDFSIVLFSIDYPRKFVSLEHRQVLGSLMSLGLKRGKFGDILIKDGEIQFIAAEEIADYIRLHLEAVGRTKISLQQKPLAEIIAVEEQWNEATVTVSSLRLDAVLSQAFGASRQTVQTLIANGFVKVNWKVVEQAHAECKEGDTLSARGLGRLKIIAIDGKTKKDRWRLQIGVQK